MTLWSTGSIVVDWPLRVPAIPERGGDVIGVAAEMIVGGAFNVDAAAARQGARVVSASPIGTGRLGQLVKDALASEGIEVLPAYQRASETGLDQGICIALVDAEGERTFVTTEGAETHPSVDALATIDPEPGDVVYISGYDLVYAGAVDAFTEFLRSLAQEGEDAARPFVVVDPSPLIADISPELWEIIATRADLLSLNEREAGILLGLGEDVVDGAALVAQIGTKVSGWVLVRVGSDGAWLAREGVAPVHVPALEVTMVDATGAGDAHAGILCASLDGLTEVSLDDLERAVARANVGAAIAVTRIGSATSPTAAEIDEVLRG